MSLADRSNVLAGTVADFDASTGWGLVCTDDGDEYPFHCTAIADGTRAIEIGIAVIFHLVPGHRGEWEAAGITPR